MRHPGLELSKTVFIIGATGQLGSRVADDFSFLGWDVILSSRVRPAHRFAFIEYLSGQVELPDSVRLIVDCIGPRQEDFKSNSTETYYALDYHFEWLQYLAHSHPQAKVIRFSSCKVYDFESCNVATESSDLTSKNPYGVFHLRAESLLGNIDNHLVFRLSNCYGRPGSSGTLNPNLITNFVFNELDRTGRVVLSGHPETRRNFFPAASLVKSLIWAIERDLSGTYNLGSDHSVSLSLWVATLVQTWNQVYQTDCEFEFESVDQVPTVEIVSSQKLLKTGLAGISTDFREVSDLARYCGRAGK